MRINEDLKNHWKGLNWAGAITGVSNIFNSNYPVFDGLLLGYSFSTLSINGIAMCQGNTTDEWETGGVQIYVKTTDAITGWRSDAKLTLVPFNT
jgi:hypothetical protein